MKLKRAVSPVAVVVMVHDDETKGIKGSKR